MTEIKMPIHFHANYRVIIRTKDWETRERAQKLTVRELSPEERKASFKDLAEKGLAIVLISDDVGEIMTTSNRVMIMNAGKVVFESDTRTVSASDISRRIIGAY